LRRILHSAGRAAAPLLLSALLLELALHLAFPLLPHSLIRHIPQYHLRLGFDLATRHGALEYPAEQEARYTIDEQFGDLYHLTCLSPALAPPFEKPYAVKFQRDKHGFRNEAAWPETVDLLLLGDSFTAAEAVQRPFWQGLADATLALGLPGSGTLEQERLCGIMAGRASPR